MLNVISLALSNSRAIILSPVLNISVQLGGQIMAVCIFNVSTLAGVIKVNIFVQSLLLVVGVIYVLSELRHQGGKS